MTKHGFIEGIGVGILAGAAIGMAVAATPSVGYDMRRVAKKASRRIERAKDDLTNAMGL